MRQMKGFLIFRQKLICIGIGEVMLVISAVIAVKVFKKYIAFHSYFFGFVCLTVW
jgi:hypothetical protein